MDRTTALELISQITQFNDISGEAEDEDLDTALALMVKLTMNPDVKQAAIPNLIVQLQAYSAKFQVLAMYYTSISKGRSGSVEYKRKNIYYTVSDALDKLVGALKYRMKMPV